MRRALTAFVILTNIACGGQASYAEEYPDHPIRIINPFSPGGSSDTLARTIGLYLTQRINQPVIVESRAGAGGVIGADAVAKSAPDGYTLLEGTNFLPIAVHTHKSLPFDVLKDLTPVVLIGGTPMLLVANPQLPANNIAELVALAKSKPGQINYGSPGTGTPNHLAMELFCEELGLQMSHVPYRSNPLAMTDVIAGHVSLLLDFVSTGAPHVQHGSVRALATTGRIRSKILPDVPTMMESGVAGFEARGWFAIFAPGGTPKSVVNKLYSEISAVLALPEVQERMDALGIELTVAGPDELADLVRSDIAKWGPVVERSGLIKE
jgi:tripartite-type tricarboxylate transporter receptor subunit TctC